MLCAVIGWQAVGAGQRVQRGQPNQPHRPGHNATIHADLVSKVPLQMIQNKTGPTLVMAINGLQGGLAAAATAHGRLEAGDHKESGGKKALPGRECLF